MSSTITPQNLDIEEIVLNLPDHTHLPDSDGKFVFAERAAKICKSILKAFS